MAQDPYVIMHLMLRDALGNPVVSQEGDTVFGDVQMMDFCENGTGKICQISSLGGRKPLLVANESFGDMTSYKWGILRMELNWHGEKMEVRIHPDWEEIKASKEARDPLWGFILHLDITWAPGYHEITAMDMEMDVASYTQSRDQALPLVLPADRQLDPILTHKVKWKR